MEDCVRDGSTSGAVHSSGYVSSLASFSEQVREQIDFAEGNSALTSACWKSGLILRLLGNSGCSDSVYVFTDGGDNISHSHGRDVRNTLVAAGVRLHVTLLAPGTHLFYRSHSPAEEAGAPELADLVSESGGLLMNPFSTSGPGFQGYPLR
jgi:hypothetical protein